MGKLDNTNAKKGRAIMPVSLQILLGAELAAVIGAAFLYLPPAKGFARPEAARIIVFHVPCAMLAVLAYVISTVYAIAYLARPNQLTDAKSAISAWLGFVFSGLATVSGMIFAKLEWGAAWNWDPKETSMLMLIVVYAGYFALRGAVSARVARAKISAAYNITACLIMPYLVFVLPRVMPSLHPSNTLAHGGLAPQYRIVLSAAMIGMVGLFIWIFRARVRWAECESARKAGK